MDVIEYSGPETVERVNRATILMIRAAMDKIERLGYTRDEYSLDTVDGSFPFTIVLRGTPVFRVDIGTFSSLDESLSVSVNSVWIAKVSPKGIWRKIVSFFYKEIDA